MSCKTCKDMPTYPLSFRVQKPSTAVDSFGHVDDDVWIAMGGIRGRVITRGGRESYRFKHVEATVDMLVMTPFTSISKIPLPTWRLILNGRELNITRAYRVNEIEREVLIAVTERV